MEIGAIEAILPITRWPQLLYGLRGDDMTDKDEDYSSAAEPAERLDESWGQEIRHGDEIEKSAGATEYERRDGGAPTRDQRKI